jgi:hypothetical protein
MVEWSHHGAVPVAAAFPGATDVYVYVAVVPEGRREVVPHPAPLQTQSKNAAH